VSKSKVSYRLTSAIAKRELDRIERETGAIMPEEVVRRAKSPYSPLHGHFDWSDRVAAKKWRLMQATQLILSVRLSGDDGASRRQFVNIGYGAGFASMEKVRANPDIAAQVAKAAHDEIEDWVRRYQDISEALGFAKEAVKTLSKKNKKRRSA